ncbi:hypothetical protein FOPE_06510 [Fonsecaea pedrosoi]|nr:hypothetical protein FOPE_06510 [Fonsecaea pedrosoi]
MAYVGKGEAQCRQRRGYRDRTILVYTQQITRRSPRAAYEDHEAAERASRKLSFMRQGTKTFSTFLAEFDRTILDAGGLSWDDQVKKTFLANCLSYELQNAIVATPIPRSYKEYCTLLHTVSTNLENLQRKKGRDKPRTTRSSSAPIEVAPAEDLMEWEPSDATTAAVVRTQRAQWVSKEILDKRKEAGRCLRCGSGEHFVRQCSLLPAMRPRAGRTVATAITAEEGEEDLKNE